jgi:hypothetical protein
MKKPELYNIFVRINIDTDISTKRRPDIFYNIQRELNIKIVEVPTIITPGPEYVLAGADAFDWLEQQIQSHKSNTNESIQGFNSIEMGSFSDSYSTYGSTDLYDAKEQTFKFIGKQDDKIETPPETASVSKGDFEKKYQERESFDNVHYNTKSNKNITKQPNSQQQNHQPNFQQQNHQPNFQQPNFQQPNFQQPNFQQPNFGNNGKSNISEKQKDLDAKYHQLLADRGNL